ncbi:(Na+)-NQR maturation NqrM [Aggregatibacter actinomycetemcomitans]|uniref:(Na+)-NQR maturation NqrM n=1 Tax=Aggregatibacter actinomycetemcomitans TaxID=714 RepID=UPI0011DB64A6|nr:(Na+)-NQR maturation NqrM [Aggregatibacter actinomycetemcomitans]TYA15702.1 (Na+)-NQR maturation NqrM [Aggregatibacter actinomycetemcomitans]TYA32546.1 (Na+)-NQR maturation NqrM [Aggregatibacter actinomycetemcomitans]TYA99416.1 (Na+)-NQR maturation NqrM [Aggregatibacter actinomycetemcomitans]TYB13905.1 (Na+)-NQR maturation NqrM [Aggregatibacter actinomycetemcomitans]TYB15032.1 (Na+)-NQR maturation NqrM [Aggregatibacter actinomycetemcomitans]
MKLFLLTLGIFLLIILAMALGYIVKRQALKGSCGGLSSLGIAKACDCDKPCDTLQSKLDAGDEQAKVEYEKKFTNNVQTQFYEVK